MATDKGVWGLQQVRDKQLQDLWGYTAFGDAGGLYSYGYNDTGELGQNNRTKYSSPVQIPGSWKDAGGVKSDGTLWLWGGNNIGVLGQNNTTSYSSPVQVPGTTWKAAFGTVRPTSETSVAAIKTDGTLWTWGFNFYGQLGQNEAGSPGSPSNEKSTSLSSPTQVPGTTWGTEGHNKFGWSGGYSSWTAIKTDGTLWAWGAQGYGNLGQNQANVYYSSPVQIGTDSTWKSISRGQSSAFMGTKTDGTLWGWGRNEFGQLGFNSTANYSSPTQIPGTTWDIATGGFYNGVVTKTDGTLWIMGYGNYGGLGLATPAGDTGNTKYSSPVQIGTDSTWSRPVPLGQYAAGAIKTDGTLWVWGQNDGGKLGLNSTANPNSPVQVTGAWLDSRGSSNVTRSIKEL